MNPTPKTKRLTILIVDDTPENIDILVAILSPEYALKVAVNGERALKLAQMPPYPDLILLDIMMPGMSGYELCSRIKQIPELRKIPVIFITAMNESEDEQLGLALGAVDYIIKPMSPPIVLARIKTHLQLYDQTRTLEQMVQNRTIELEHTRQQVILRLGRAAEFKDNETGNHVLRMSHYSRLIAEAAQLDRRVVDLLFHVAPMHDVGKIGIPDSVLLKPESLNAEEWALMRQHPQMGADIIGEHPDDLLQAARLVALTHHEKWNGSGYPAGLKGDEIPLLGRIVAIADVFDALTSARPYKAAWPIEQAVTLIEEGSGIHFDPGLILPFRTALPQMLMIKERYAEERGAITDGSSS